ncbi:substrate-binding domain-containing protein [candidate division KSB1 bacterium]|nr:substrate-binding domain-containing protein [candidate division KSB1 bacterium]
MNRIVLWTAFLLGSLSGCNRQESETTPTKGNVTAIVSESHAPLLQKEADQFHRLYTQAQVTLFSATTREAIVHLLNDSVRIIIIDRALNEEERSVAAAAEIKYTETKIAEDALVIVAHNENPIKNISLNSLSQIVTREVTQWRQVPESKWSGPIEFAFTGRNSGAYELLASHFLKLQKEAVPTSPADTQKEVLDYVASHPRALGVVSAACFYSVTRPNGIQDTTAVTPLRALAVERKDSTAADEYVKLHQANVYRGFYPLHYGVYIYYTVSEKRNLGPELGFTTFVASHPGQKIIMDAGLVPATMPIRLVQINED